MKAYRRKKFWFFVRHYLHSLRVMNKQDPDNDLAFIRGRDESFICAKDGSVLAKKPIPELKYRLF